MRSWRISRCFQHLNTFLEAPWRRNKHRVEAQAFCHVAQDVSLHSGWVMALLQDEMEEAPVFEFFFPPCFFFHDFFFPGGVIKRDMKRCFSDVFLKLELES